MYDIVAALHITALNGNSSNRKIKVRPKIFFCSKNQIYKSAFHFFKQWNFVSHSELMGEKKIEPRPAGQPVRENE